jgi:hypothetical protein
LVAYMAPRTPLSLRGALAEIKSTGTHSDEAIIPHRLGDEGLGCLYGTKDTSLIARRSCRDKTHWNPCGTILRAKLRRQTLALARRLLRYKIHWKPCETIPRGGPTMLRIWAYLVNFSILFRDYTIEME